MYLSSQVQKGMFPKFELYYKEGCASQKYIFLPLSKNKKRKVLPRSLKRATFS